MLPKTAKDTKDSQSRLDFFLMLEAIEGLIKTLLSQAQEKPSSACVQNMGMGYRSGNNSELPGRPLKIFSSGTELICFGCGESGHFQNNCE